MAQVEKPHDSHVTEVDAAVEAVAQDPDTGDKN